MILVFLALCLPPAFSTPALQAPSPLEELEIWIGRQRRFLRPLEESRESELRELLGALRATTDANPGLRPQATQLLLELAELDWAEGRRGAATPHSDFALAEIDRLLRRGRDDQVAEWLATEIVGGTDVAPKQRYIAAELLRERYVSGTLPALYGAASSEDETLSQLATEALVGWNATAVHLFFLKGLEETAVVFPKIARHFRSVGSDLPDPILEELRRAIGRLYVSPNWRDAARARSLVGALDSPRAIPILLEALTVWQRRLEKGDGSLRIRHEVVLELRKLSGRAIGPDPERWALWWEAVQEGRIQLADEGPPISQSPEFFGLRPVSGRLLFVVDRSRSMRTSFGTDGRTRHEEAIFQLLAYLEKSGEDTLFSVVLFNDRTARWRSRLNRASASNLAHLRRWLDSKPADGSTQLREGIAAALELNGAGLIPLERVEADTVIVLCDGETDSGPAWIRPWLERVNGEAQIVFHCVQIGSEGDGSLRQLAEGTGGDYIRNPG